MSQCFIADCSADDRTPVAIPGICDHCAARGLEAIRALLRAYVGLSIALAKGGSAGSERVSTSLPGSWSPLREEVYDLSTRIVCRVLEWEDGCRAELSWSPRQPLPDGPAVERAVRTLTAAAWVPFLSTSWGHRVITDVLHLRQRAYLLLRWSELVHAMPLPCPRCDLLALVRPNGEGWVNCTRCGLFLDGDAYRDAVRSKLDELCPSH